MPNNRQIPQQPCPKTKTSYLEQIFKNPNPEIIITDWQEYDLGNDLLGWDNDNRDSTLWEDLLFIELNRTTWWWVCPI